MLTLDYIIGHCDDWEAFCDDLGFSVWAVNEGGGDCEVDLTGEQMVKHGITPPNPENDSLKALLKEAQECFCSNPLGAPPGLIDRIGAALVEEE